jgi:hypothetical protein
MRLQSGVHELCAIVQAERAGSPVRHAEEYDEIK